MKKMRAILSFRRGGAAVFCVLLCWSFYSADARTSQSATPGMHRILVKVFDAETKQPLAARVSFTDGEGEYFPPYGHPRKIPSGPWVEIWHCLMARTMPTSIKSSKLSYPRA